MNVLVVSASGLYETYNSGSLVVSAPQDIDLSVTRGAMVAIMGPSGCGKITLLDCLYGIGSLSKGEIVIGGRSIHELSDDELSEFR